MKRNAKIIALVLALTLAVSLLPAAALADTPAEAGSLIVKQSVSDDAGFITLEAYADAPVVVPSESVTAPTDIILVLDQSGSMSEKYDAKTTRQQALKSAVSSFTSQLGGICADGSNHRLAIVTFSNKASTLIDWTDTDADGLAKINEKVNSLPELPTGATYMDTGLTKAYNLFNDRGETTYTLADGQTRERKLLVVVFTDGYPGTLNAVGDYFSNAYDTPDEADDAVAAAAKLKELGAVVYTVGAFKDANPAASYKTQKNSIIWTVWRSAAKSANGFMHFLSSDYGADCKSWRDHTANNDGRNCGYYLAASDSAALVRAFGEIASEVVSENGSVTPDGEYVLRETVSEYFTVNGEVTASVSYDGTDEALPFEGKISVEGNTVCVSGFDYAAHWCEEGRKNGQKLTVRIPIKENSCGYGTFAVSDPDSGIYSPEGVMVSAVPAAKLEVKSLVDLSANESWTADMEKFFMGLYGDYSVFYQKLYPTLSSLRTIGDNIFLVDYQYDYDIDDLMERGVSSALELLAYASLHITGGAYTFKLGDWGLGCSAFEAHNENGDHIMGRNFDYMDAPCYVVWTHPDDAYASISMVDGTFMLTTDNLLRPTSTYGRLQTLLAPYLPLDGMNETGFAISVLQIHADGTKQDTGKPDMFTTAMIRACLDKCATVDEAIELFQCFDVQDTIALGYSLGCCFHYMLTDANGDAAVIEYVNNEMRITRPGDKGFDQLFVTNYYLAPDGGVGMESYDPEGMERWDMIAATLTENGGVLSFDQTFDLLSDVHLNYRHDNNLYDITTLWSCLYNNSRQTMSLAARMDYGSIYTFSVSDPMRVFAVDSVAVDTPKEGIGLH